MALRRMSLRDFVIVQALEIDFAAGFTALTGETGAGKSILVDALQLVMGARAVLASAKGKNDAISRWILSLEARRGYWRAVVAMAAKNARMGWAMVRHGEAFVMP